MTPWLANQLSLVLTVGLAARAAMPRACVARPQHKQTLDCWRECEHRSDLGTIATWSHWRRSSRAYASGFKQRRTPRPSGFRPFLARPSGVMVSCGPRASGLEQRRTPRPSGFRAFPARPSGVTISCGRYVRGSANAGLLLRAASTADLARAVRRAPHSSTERLHPALRATRERFDQRWTPPPSGFPPPRAGAGATG